MSQATKNVVAWIGDPEQVGLALTDRLALRMLVEMTARRRFTTALSMAELDATIDEWAAIDRSVIDGAASMGPASPHDNWTTDATGLDNSSEAFRTTVSIVAGIIRGQAHALISGDVENVARLVVAQLAHVHGFAPKEG